MLQLIGLPAEQQEETMRLQTDTIYNQQRMTKPTETVMRSQIEII